MKPLEGKDEFYVLPVRTAASKSQSGDCVCHC